MPEHVYSDTTWDIIKDNYNPNSTSKLRNRLKQYIKLRTNLDNEFDIAINRCNYFLGVSDYEYNFLKKTWDFLPTFLQAPLDILFQVKELPNKEKSNRVLVGNNRSAYNNHIDILKIIDNNYVGNNISFNLIFNYGTESNYSKIVRDTSKKTTSTSTIDDVLPLEEYKILFNTIDAFVLNGYRQMAMGAIFETLSSKVKIYLNENNEILHWLKNEGFLVFSTNDFTEDLKIDNLYLKEAEAVHNTSQFKQFRKKYNTLDFHEKILSIG